MRKMCSFKCTLDAEVKCFNNFFKLLVTDQLFFLIKYKILTRHADSCQYILNRLLTEILKISKSVQANIFFILKKLEGILRNKHKTKIYSAAALWYTDSIWLISYLSKQNILLVKNSFVYFLGLRVLFQLFLQSDMILNYTFYSIYICFAYRNSLIVFFLYRNIIVFVLPIEASLWYNFYTDSIVLSLGIMNLQGFNCHNFFQKKLIIFQYCIVITSLPFLLSNLYNTNLQLQIIVLNQKSICFYSR